MSCFQSISYKYNIKVLPLVRGWGALQARPWRTIQIQIQIETIDTNRRQNQTPLASNNNHYKYIINPLPLCYYFHQIKRIDREVFLQYKQRQLRAARAQIDRPKGLRYQPQQCLIDNTYSFFYYLGIYIDNIIVRQRERCNQEEYVVSK